MSDQAQPDFANAVAIVGRALAFPGADTPDAFWDNIAAGRSTFRDMTRQDLLAAGVPAEQVDHPDYVPVSSAYGDHAAFDAAFFGMTPREAAITDPQQRLLLELSQHALEDAGRLPGSDLKAGVFVGVGPTGYFVRNLLPNSELVRSIGFQALLLGNDKAFSAARIAYKLGLDGPVFAIDTACSTGLVAVHQACRSLLDLECDLALAGAASMMIDKGHGYLYQPGGILSPDGRCRPFAQDAQGTLFASGGAVVVLRRLQDALDDGDPIHAVILGSAINNDGAQRAGFTAPSVQGQAKVITEALQLAGVDASSIDLVECHGTGTPVGDPIEMKALSLAFRANGAVGETPYCAVGSVKSNIGHLDAAAGLAGLLKAVEAVKRGQLPPTLNAEAENPHINFAESPFYLNRSLQPWNTASPRRAGVSSFGMGGSNAHVVLEEPPPRRLPVLPRHVPILLSAKSEAALISGSKDMQRRLEVADGDDIAAVARTLASGRQAFGFRRAAVIDTAAPDLADLERPARRAFDKPRLAYVFPGQGAQRQGMAKALYADDTAFRTSIDRSAAILSRDCSLDLLAILNSDEFSLRQTANTQIALFTVAQACADALDAAGVVADGFAGHSIGEIVAAHRAGVFSLEDALRLVEARGRAMQEAPPGAMLATRLSERELAGLLGRDCWIAGINAPGSTVAAGDENAIAALEARLMAAAAPCMRLQTSHGFHSPMMSGAVEALRAVVESVRFSPPDRVLSCNVTGGLATENVASPEYWLEHILRPVRFGANLSAFLADGFNVFVEAGPGFGLTGLLAQNGGGDALAVETLGAGTALQPPILKALGELWTAGVPVDWRRMLGDGPRTSAPGYAFQRERHWIDAGLAQGDATAAQPEALLHRRVWRQAEEFGASIRCADLLLIGPVHERLSGIEGLARAEGRAVLRADAKAGAEGQASDLQSWLSSAGADSKAVHIVLAPPDAVEPAIESLLRTARTLASLQSPRAVSCTLVLQDALSAPAEDGDREVAAALAAACRVLRQEHPELTFQLVDVDDPQSETAAQTVLAQADLVCAEVETAVRGAERFSPAWESAAGGDDAIPLVKPGGVYLLVGGAGELGQRIAEELVARYRASVVLTGRRGIDERGPEIRSWLDGLGDAVVLEQADATSRKQMKAVLARARERFGRVDGVIHAAGLSHFGPLLETSAAQRKAVADPKLKGLEVLLGILSDDPPDFLVVFSSLAGVVGGMGQGAYAIASAQLDARAAGATTDFPVICLDWDAWQDIGMAARTVAPPAWAALKAKRLAAGLSPALAVEALFAALVTGGPKRCVIARRAPDLSVAASMTNRESVVIADPVGKGPEQLRALIADIWSDVLGLSTPDPERSFFELGGDSLMLTQVHSGLAARGVQIPVTELFRRPTIAGLAAAIALRSGPGPSRRNRRASTSSEIAVVGYAGRFPGAPDADELWTLIRTGASGLRSLDAAEVQASAHARDLSTRPAYVPVATGLAGIDLFDADHFDLTPREAAIMDPQQRVFLECVQLALEDAGIPTDEADRRIGLYASSAMSTYLLHNLMPTLEAAATGVEALQVAIGNETNFFASRVAYLLNLKGPAVTTSTACSSSLVSIHLACQSLLAGECDVAIAGGVKIDIHGDAGYVYEEGGLQSSDGVCRPFDSDAGGTVFGSGAGAVVLRRLDEALASGDLIHAVIRGSAINNDGRQKVGYTAPSVDGQAEVLRDCYATCDALPASIGYLETHGTGTHLGDPIEVAALSQVFTEGSCALGSLKANIGHLDAAAGVAGVIKCIEVLKRAEIPPLANFRNLNPHVSLDSTPFWIPREATAWPAGTGPRRAAVSSFGIGGTNAHLVLEEAPRRPQAAPAQDKTSLLLLSAHHPDGLLRQAQALADALESDPAPAFDGVAKTLAHGRSARRHRLAVAATAANAADRIRTRADAPGTLVTGSRKIGFLFPGQGAQYRGMFGVLYLKDPTYRAAIDDCARHLKQAHDFDLLEALGYAPVANGDAADLMLTDAAQPALFAVCYGLTCYLGRLGIRPDFSLGHSLGEYVAALLAGVFDLETGLDLVFHRGLAMQAAPQGAMAAVLAPPEAVHSILERCVIAAFNGPYSTVIAGDPGAIEASLRKAEAAGLSFRMLETTRAFHSPLIEPALGPLAAALGKADLRQPSHPFLSNTSGTWTKADEVASPDYWLQHALKPVRFSQALATASDEDVIWVEVGPGRGLTELARSLGQPMRGFAALDPGRRSAESDEDILAALGRLWEHGVDLELGGVTSASVPTVRLPPLLFERRRHWIEPAKPGSKARSSLGARLHHTVWSARRRGRDEKSLANAAVLVAGDGDLAAALIERCAGACRWTAGLRRARAMTSSEALPSGREASEIDSVLTSAAGSGAERLEILLVWPAEAETPAEFELAYEAAIELLAAIALLDIDIPVQLTVVTDRLVSAASEPARQPRQALFTGASLVLPIERDGATARHIDVDLARDASRLCDDLLQELRQTAQDPVALRGGRRLVRELMETPAASMPTPTVFRPDGVYLVTGGYGGIGRRLALELVRNGARRIAIVSRRAGMDAGSPGAGEDPADELRALGASVKTYAADVADADALRRIREDLARSWGPLTGIVHAAGVAGGATLPRRTMVDARPILHPKLDGALCLVETFGADPLDFLIFCSSLAGTLGMIGQADYCAANAFLDALAVQCADRLPVVSVAWDAWRGLGMASASPLAALLEASGSGMLSVDEGCEVFRRLAADPDRPVVAVVKGGLAERGLEIQRSRETIAGLARPAVGGAVRPALETDFVAPRTDLEAQICAAWEAGFGISGLGVHDDFFDLGGHSLLAAQFVGEAQTHYGVTLSVRTLFERPTIAGLADVITEQVLLARSTDEQEDLLHALQS